MLALDIDDFGRELYSDQVAEEELLRFAAYNILHEIVEKEHGGTVFRTRDDKLVGLVSGHQEEVEVTCQTLAEQARYSIEKYLGMTVTVGISRMYEGLQELPKAFQEALTALIIAFCWAIIASSLSEIWSSGAAWIIPAMCGWRRDSSQR